jgi:hypothetical protein
MSTTQDATEDKRYRNPKWLREQYVENGCSVTEIADTCGVSGSTINRWCEKFDIKKPETAQFGIQTGEYEQWMCEAGPGKADTVLVHRLLATLKVDELSDLDGMHVHHESEVPWDNRLDNLHVLTPSEHRCRHL